MNEKKPIPQMLRTSGIICPVCALRTYSRSGIHPQCAVSQTDAPRVEELKAARKCKVAASKQSGWGKKCFKR